VAAIKSAPTVKKKGRDQVSYCIKRSTILLTIIGEGLFKGIKSYFLLKIQGRGKRGKEIEGKKCNKKEGET